MHDQPISPLPQRMLDAMAVRNFSDKTRHDYIRQVKSFGSFLGRSPDTAGADVRQEATASALEYVARSQLNPATGEAIKIKAPA